MCFDGCVRCVGDCCGSALGSMRSASAGKQGSYTPLSAAPVVSIEMNHTCANIDEVDALFAPTVFVIE